MVISRSSHVNFACKYLFTIFFDKRYNKPKKEVYFYELSKKSKKFIETYCENFLKTIELVK